MVKNLILISNLGNKRKYKLHYKDLNWDHNHKKFSIKIQIKIILKAIYQTKYRITKRSRKIVKSKKNAKLRNNAIFGKAIENPINKFDVRIVTTKKKYLKWSFRPIFKREKVFCNGTIAVEKSVEQTLIN